MSYELTSRKLIAQSLEYSVTYHCNLRCAGCSHLSPFASRRFPTLDSFAADIERLGSVFHARVIRLLGGEPLLNRELESFLRLAKESEIADRVMVTTNGLLLHELAEGFWEHLDILLVTRYPGVRIQADMSEISERASEFDVEVWEQPMPRFRSTTVTRPQARDWVTDTIFKTCKDVHEFHCHMLHEGTLYRCAVPPFLPEYVRKLGAEVYDPAPDGLDIQSSRDLRADLESFLVSERTPESCRYCLGYLGKSTPHRQLSRAALDDPSTLDLSRENGLDRTRLMHTLVADRPPSPAASE